MNQPSPSLRRLLARLAILVAILGLVWIARQRDPPPAERAEPVDAPPQVPVTRSAPPVVEPGWTPPPRSPAVETDAGRVASAPGATTPKESSGTPPKRPAERPKGPSREGAASAERLVIEGLALRDANGRTIYRGPIDLAPTLERIAAGKRLRFPNDGVTFQNRERRLPGRPSGYYREWVVPTPGESGPGPQRLVTGEDGEVWYTPDHYRSFRRISTKVLAR